MSKHERSCLHPVVVDVYVAASEKRRCPSTYGWYRVCAMCDLSYNRSQRILIELRNQCRRAWSVNFRRVADAIRDEGDYRHEEFA